MAPDVTSKYKKSDSTDYDSDPNYDSDAKQSDITVAYLSSGGTSSGKSHGSSSSESDSFVSSDDEPLSKYKKQQVHKDNPDIPSHEVATEPPTTICKRGQPKGPAKAPKRQSAKPTSVSHQNVRRDMIDEECAHLGIYYRRWKPMNPEQTS